jgi:hypothetical protein
MITFEIFLMYHDRPLMAAEQINALQNLIVPKGIDLTVIISDNSTVPETLKVPKDYEIRYRNNVLGHDHLNICISETVADRFMLIHDDDIIDSKLLCRLHKYLLDKELANFVIAGTSVVFEEEISTIRGRFNYCASVIYPTVETFLLGLFVFKGRRYPAFPSYVYTNKVKKHLNCCLENGGRFADVSFLMDVYKMGKVVWVPEEIYWYRIHKNNDGHVADVDSMKSLFRYIRRYDVKFFTKLLVLTIYGKNIILKKLRLLLNV